ncbi:HIT domain-containing protein [Luteolibacter flavescens]|uniref:HIT domain-containing protein n=1 Tax=Luteolibacter flavescens TaxID=1859460 RepID=A0ABT3FV49_9BACT|nr:HIT domain-containing protein [Luteolibacter flavescens]MCW1886855.1 HIT domain-containing protein [Luteolibacter flavescens]
MSADFYCDSVLSGQVPVQVVMETQRVLAFEHTRPTWQMHVVIIPKQHIARLVDVTDPTLLSELLEVAVAIIRDRDLAGTNYKLITNGGSYQSTPHLHLHLVSGSPLDPHDPAQAGEMAV